MKRLSTICLSILLLFATQGLAKTPSRPGPPVTPPPRPPVKIEVPGEQPVQLVDAEVRVQVEGVYARTTQTLRFHNPSNRRLEGTLVFPLPDGSTISGYGLDINGQLVDGVVVPKQQARKILEAEERKRIDPGIVEKVAGNVFRTRIYPIPARGSRTVRVRYVSPLAIRGDEAAYPLLIPQAEELAQLRLFIEVISSPVTPLLTGTLGNLNLTRWRDGWRAEATLDRPQPGVDLTVRLPNLPATVVQREWTPDGDTVVSVSHRVGQGSRTGRKAPAPRRIGLVWDASGSRTDEEVERELAFLEGMLNQWTETSILLFVVRNDAVSETGQWVGRRAQLIEKLRSEPRDGGTDLSRVDLSRDAGVDQWFVFTDGLRTLGGPVRNGSTPVHSVTGSHRGDPAILRHLADATGGRYLPLGTLGIEAALTALNDNAPRLSGGMVDGLPLVAAHIRRGGGDREALITRLPAHAHSMRLTYSDGSDVDLVLPDPADRDEDLSVGLALYAWATLEADRLALHEEANKHKLIAHGQKYAVVTAGTSLLVLETLQQHLEYGVEPAVTRTQMHTQYMNAMKNRRQQRKMSRQSHIERVVAMWRQRVNWWKADFSYRPEPRFESKREPGRAGPRRSMHRDDRMAFNETEPEVVEEQSMAQVRQERSRVARKSSVARPMAATPAEGMVMADREIAAESEMDAVGQGYTGASNRVQGWNPDTPYLRELRRAGPERAYGVYLTQRTKYARSPSFFLDAAGYFFANGQEVYGLRVLSNLAELGIDDAAMLRVYAWRLQEAGAWDRSVEMLEKVLRDRDDEPQSHRDLALALVARCEASPNLIDAQRAVDRLWHVANTPWERFEGIQLTALNELNRFIAWAERNGLGPALETAQIDSRLRDNLDMDLRIVLSWDADNTDVDLHLFEPTGEHANYSHNRTRQGGLVSRDFTQGYGPEEYLLRSAQQGVYTVKAHYYGSRQQTVLGPATVTATVYTNYGRANENKQVLTLRLDRVRQMVEVGAITLEAGRERQPSFVNFKKLRKGMTHAEVDRVLGAPSEMRGDDEVQMHYRQTNGDLVVVMERGEVVSARKLVGGGWIELLP